MTPQSRGPAASRSHALVRRSAIALGAFFAIVGTPLVASALDNDTVDPTDSLPTDRSSVADAAAIIVPVASEPELDPEAEAEAEADVVMAILTDDYRWGEQGPRIAALQEALDIDVNASYWYRTQQAHRAAFEYLGLPLDALPGPLLPAGTEESQWASLRDCESNGNYGIVNRSGKYRGAYQFGRATWDSVAGRHAPELVGVDPAAASPAEQDAMAYALYGERGARPWPLCGRHLP